MTRIAPQDLPSIDVVRSLISAPGLPPAARKTCEALVAKLDAPLRIGIFGLEGSGKKRILNALTGETVAPEDLHLPTTEVLPGARASTKVMLGDGATRETRGYPSKDTLEQGPIFLSITSPACQLLRQSFLLTVCDDTFEDLSAGLSWAAPRIDLAIWCTEHWTDREQRVLLLAPDHLKDHAVLCRSSSVPLEPAVPDGFDTAFHLDPSEETGSACAALRDHVRQVIEEARKADGLAAELLLHRYQEYLAERPTAVSEPAKSVAPQDIDAGAVSQLTSLFRHLRSSAAALRRANAGSAEVLSGLDAFFQDLADQATGLDAVGDAWPEITDAISDARDLCVLLKMEGGDDQAEDAARVLLQLRWDMQEKLAA